MTSQPPPPPPPAGDPSWSASGGQSAGADAGPRAGARIIDGILLAIVVAIISFVIIVPLILADSATGSTGMTSILGGGGLSGSALISSVIGLAINFGYYIGLDTTIGGTLGKKMLGMSVKGAAGGNPTVEESFKRNAWLLLSIIPFIGGLLQLGAAIYILVTISNDPANVGWHDRFAGGTRVVKG